MGLPTQQLLAELKNLATKLSPDNPITYTSRVALEKQHSAYPAIFTKICNETSQLIGLASHRYQDKVNRMVARVNAEAECAALLRNKQSRKISDATAKAIDKEGDRGSAKTLKAAVRFAVQESEPNAKKKRKRARKKSTTPSNSPKDRGGSKQPESDPDTGNQDRKRKGKKRKANPGPADDSSKPRPKKKAKKAKVPQPEATPKAAQKPKGNRNRGGSSKGGKGKRK